MTLPPLLTSRPTQILFKSINDKMVDDKASYERIYMCPLEFTVVPQNSILVKK